MNSRPNIALSGISPFFLQNGYELDPLIEPTPAKQTPSRHPSMIKGHECVERFKNAQDFAQAAMASA